MLHYEETTQNTFLVVIKFRLFHNTPALCLIPTIHIFESVNADFLRNTDS